jgi:hypothetical protein
LFLVGGFLGANGVQESRLAKAKELIAQKNYNDAMLVLETMVREEPDRLDEAQELIGEIRAVRDQYNSNYERVINQLYVQNDEQSALKLISELEVLDKNPNKQTLDTIALAKRTARLIANNKTSLDITARARALLAQKQYGAAVKVYLEGHDLARDMFLESGFGNVVTNQVDRAWEDLTAAANLFQGAEASLKTLPDQGTTLLVSLSPSVTAVNTMLSSMQAFASWRQRIWAAGRLFKIQNDFVVKNGRPLDYFLDYSYKFVHGPGEQKLLDGKTFTPDPKSPEGILGAMDRLWDEILGPWTAQVRLGVDAQYTKAKGLFDQGQYAEAAAAFDVLRAQARRGLDVITLWNRVAGVDETGAIDADLRSDLNTVLPIGVWLDHRLTLAVQGAQAARSLDRGTQLVADKGLDRPGLESARAELRSQKEAFAANALTAGTWTGQQRALSTDGFVLIDPAGFSTSWQNTWAGFRQKTQGQEAGFVDRRGALDYGLLDGRFRDLQATLTGARNQVEGTVKYPLQATSVLKDLRPLQDSLAKDIGSFVSLYEGESPDVKTPAVAAWPVKGRDLAGQLTAAQTLQGQLLAAAQTNYAQSQLLKKQGQDLIPQIDPLVTAENFAQARTVLTNVSARYSQSLALQEDPAFRTDSDAQVKALGAAILEAENRVVVRDVRQFITQGSDQFFAQQFAQSEQTLIKARNRWAVTNSTANSEVEYWLGLVSVALSASSNRVLSPIDPLYNEVQQLLNFAQRDFTLGQTQLEAAKDDPAQKDPGLEHMKEANDILDKILLTFPNNQAAGLLKLQILQASDPTNFPATFKKQFDAAVAKLADKTSEAYNELQDLDKILPNAPGMADAIHQAQVRLGIIKQAKDPKITAQVNTLLTQVGRLVAGGSTNQLTQAQGLIRQILALDPRNVEAQTFSDQVSLKLTPTVGVMTPTLVGEVNDILDLLRGQKNLEALSRKNQFVSDHPNLLNDPQVKIMIQRVSAANQ